MSTRAPAHQPPRKRLSKSLDDIDLFELYNEGLLEDADLVELMNSKTTSRKPKVEDHDRPRFTTSLNKKQPVKADNAKQNLSVNNQLGVNNDLYPAAQSSSSILDVNKSYERRRVNLAQGSSNPLSLY